MFDRVADRYDETRGGEERGTQLAEDILPWLTPGLTLEVGVGTGLVSVALCRAGVDVLGVDISAGMLAHAHRRLGGRVFRGDAQALPLPDGLCANVAFVWMLVFVDDPGAALREAARVSRAGGRVVVVGGRPAADVTEVDALTAPLDVLRPARPQDLDDRVPALAATAGLRLRHRGLTRGQALEQVPAQAAQTLQERQPAWLADVDRTMWTSTVQPVIDALRAMPDPDRPRQYLQRNTVTVFDRP